MGRAKAAAACTAAIGSNAAQAECAQTGAGRGVHLVGAGGKLEGGGVLQVPAALESDAFQALSSQARAHLSRLER